MIFFVSHSHKDKDVLSDMKKNFDFHGIHFFLAHEDLEAGENWNIEIRRKLNDCDIFLLCANQNSKESSFCNQEIGWAVSKDKPMLVLGDEKTQDFHWGLMDPVQSCATLRTRCQSNNYEAFRKIFNTKATRTKLGPVEKLKHLETVFGKEYEGFSIVKPEVAGCTYPDHVDRLCGKKTNLLPTCWDDASYRTAFDLYLGQKRVGRVKICSTEQRLNAHTSEQLPDNFLFLPRNFLSHYIGDTRNEGHLMEATLFLLNEHTAAKSFPEEFRDLDVVKKSFFRNNPEKLEGFWNTLQSKGA